MLSEVQRSRQGRLFRCEPKCMTTCPARFSAVGSDAARLLKVLGQARFERLQKAFGGRRLWIPKSGTHYPCGACSRRVRCIRRWRKQGRPARAIAERLGLSPKTVYRVLAKSGPGD